jgi:hypothetical protein
MAPIFFGKIQEELRSVININPQTREVMTIKIDDQLFISEVQTRFSEAFPFLRLDFFQPAWNPLLIRLQPEMSSGKKLANLKKETKAANFFISPTDKVSAVEQHFRELYMLEAQVMSCRGNTWLTASEKNDYTLEQQNALGQGLPPINPAK